MNAGIETAQEQHAVPLHFKIERLDFPEELSGRLPRSADAHAERFAAHDVFGIGSHRPRARCRDPNLLASSEFQARSLARVQLAFVDHLPCRDLEAPPNRWARVWLVGWDRWHWSLAC